MNTESYCGKRKIHALEWVCIVALVALLIIGTIWAAQEISYINAARMDRPAPRIVIDWEVA